MPTDQSDYDQVGHVPQRLGGQEPAAAGANDHDAMASWPTSWLLLRPRGEDPQRRASLSRNLDLTAAHPPAPSSCFASPRCAPCRSLARFHRRLPPNRSGEQIRLVLGHVGARTVAFELPGGGANVSGRGSGLSIRADQVLYHASKVKIAIPTTLTRICIQIASVVSYIMK